MIQIRVGDIINVRERDEENKSNEVIKTYQVDDIPKHHRFIVCCLLKDDQRTGLIRTFDRLELKIGLVWGGTRVEDRAVRTNRRKIEDWSNTELIRYCRQYKIKCYYRMNREEMIAAVKKYIKSNRKRCRAC